MVFETVAVLLTLLLWVELWWEIFRKAGCPGYLGLLMAIPVVNFVMLIAMIMMDWPVQRELARLRLRLGEATEQDASRVLSEATKLDQRGEWAESIVPYELIAERMPNNDVSQDARRLIEGVREKLAAAGA